MKINYLDLAPLRRTTVGFDRLFDFINNAAVADTTDSYPPFDIEKAGEDSYSIVLALAGFTRDEVNVETTDNLLTITGRKLPEQGPDDRYVHRGIAAAPFERRFQLADHVQVESAQFDRGLLTITLRREVPAAMKPRKIEIGAAETAPVTA